MNYHRAQTSIFFLLFFVPLCISPNMQSASPIVAKLPCAYTLLRTRLIQSAQKTVPHVHRAAPIIRCTPRDGQHSLSIRRYSRHHAELTYGYHLSFKADDTTITHKRKQSTTHAAIPQFFGTTARRIRPNDTFVPSTITPEIVEKGIELAMSNSNSMHHIFANKNHQLTILLERYGSQEAVLRAVLTAADGRLPSCGIFYDFPIPVDKYTVYIRGNMIKGIPRLSTMFIPLVLKGQR